MSMGTIQAPSRPLHPLHAVLVAGSTPLFIGAALSDWAYSSSPIPQWANFAAWLLVGAMVLTGLALLWALIALALSRRGGALGLIFVLALVAAFILGFIASLVHAKDAWAMMPEGLVLSVLTAATSIVATWAGFARGAAR